MRKVNERVYFVCCACLVALTAACGGDDDGAGTGAAGTGAAGTGAAGSGTAGTGAGTADGEVSEAYSDYCVATFTEDYEVVDVFGDTELNIDSGAQRTSPSTKTKR